MPMRISCFSLERLSKQNTSWTIIRPYVWWTNILKHSGHADGVVQHSHDSAVDREIFSKEKEDDPWIGKENKEQGNQREGKLQSIRVCSNDTK